MEKEQFEILMEVMNSKFKLVLEGQESLRSEIRAFRDKNNAKHDHTVFLLQTLIDKIDSRYL
jgi:hypothetical protein